MRKYGSSISENISIIKEILRLISLVVDFFGVTTYSKLMRFQGMIFEAGVLAALLAVISVLLFVDFGGESSRIAHEMSNFGHLPLFGVTALVILWMLGGRTWPVRDKRKYAVSFAAALGLGVVTEFVQLYTPERYFEIQDIVYDALGAFTFLAFAYPFSGLPKRKALGWKAACAGMIALAAVPVALTALDVRRMEGAFPLLASFETRIEMDRWETTECLVNRTKEHASHGAYALMARLAPGEFPGISMRWLEGDWREYDELCFDAFLDGDSPLAVTVRIHDEIHGRSEVQSYSDRFNKRFVLHPGAQQIRIGLDEVRTAPGGREMDMSRVANICVFAYRLGEERVVYLDHFRLVRGSGLDI